MNPYPEFGNLKLGSVSVPVSSFLEHLLILGASGCGKSTLVCALLEQLLQMDSLERARKHSAVIIDVKGDLLPVITEILTNCGRKEDLVVLGPDTAQAGWDPFAQEDLAPDEIARLLVSAVSTRGQELGQSPKSEELFWSTSRDQLLAALVEVAQLTARETGRGPVRLSQLLRLGRALVAPEANAKTWAEKLGPALSESAAAALTSFYKLPDTTLGCVYQSVQAILNPFARAPLKLFLEPAGARSQVDITRDVFLEGKVIVVTAGRAEYSVDCLPGLVLFKAALFRAVLSRLRLCQEAQTRPVWIVLDEFNRTLLANESAGLACEHLAMEMARANRVGFVLAAQNLAGLVAIAGESLVAKIAALCRTLVFFGNSCPWTLKLAQQVCGNHFVHRKHISVAKQLPPPLLFPENMPQNIDAPAHMLVPYEQPVVSPDRLARLRTGEAVAKFADGSVGWLTTQPPD